MSVLNCLLDTHTFLWMDDADNFLSDRVRTLIEDEEAGLFLSYVSMWEILIKAGTGKLKLRLPLEQMIQEQQDKNRLQLLRIELSHMYTLQKLPQVSHRDPFDRLLVAQAI